MFCTTCGVQITGNSKFCTNCGAKFTPINNAFPNENTGIIQSGNQDIAGLATAEEKIIFCTTCGTQIFGNNKFCTNCGTNHTELVMPLLVEERKISLSGEETIQIIPFTEARKIYCTNCGALIPDKSKFCTSCGLSYMETDKAIVEEEVKIIQIQPTNIATPDLDPGEVKKKKFCTSCGIQVPDNSKFCTGCGTSYIETNKAMPEEVVKTIQPANIYTPDLIPVKEKRKTGKSLLFGLIVTGAIILCGIGFILWSNTLSPTGGNISENKDSTLAINSTAKLNSAIDNSQKYSAADTAKTLLLIDSIIKDHEVSTKTKLNEENRKELTDSLFETHIRGASVTEKIQSFSQYFTVISTSAEISSKPKELKAVKGSKKRRASKYDKFK